MTAQQPVSVPFQRPAPFLAHEPARSLFTIYSAVKFLASAPFLYIWFLIPSNRGTPKRTPKQEVRFSMLRAIFRWCHATRFHIVPTRQPPKSWKDQFVLFDPAKESLYTGYAVDHYIKPEPIPGVWYPRRPDAKEVRDNQRVLVHFHGGAYASGQYEPDATAVVGQMLAKKLSAFVLCAGYRKSAQAGRHFPTQLQDAITTYNYLLGLGIDSKQILFSGSSSGAHMALDLLRYIVENPELGLPKPAAIILSSPWVDFSTIDTSAILARPNFKKDYIDMPFIMWARETFLPPTISVGDCPYLSLIDHPFSFGGVPAWMAAGLDECVHEETRVFVEKSRAMGNVVEFYEAPDAPHDVLWTGPLVGFSEASEQACDKVREFVEKYQK